MKFNLQNMQNYAAITMLMSGADNLLKPKILSGQNVYIANS